MDTVGQMRSRDEYPRPRGDAEAWFDHYYLDFFAGDGSLAGYIALTVCPHVGQSWYWTALIRPDQQTVYVVDNELPVPAGTALELRGSGIWQDIVVETPFDHVSVGLEAFGVALEQPAEAFGNMFGDRTPLGYELDWDTEGEVEPLTNGYHIPCRVHGEVLVGQDAYELDGFGSRSHRWGTQPAWLHRGPHVAGHGDAGAFHGAATSTDLAAALVYAPVAVPPLGGGCRLHLGFGVLRDGHGWLQRRDPTG